MKTNTNQNQFEVDMERAIADAIAHLDRSTVGISTDCLWQLTSNRIKSTAGPRGTNAAYFAREVFNKIIARPVYKNFVYIA